MARAEVGNVRLAGLSGAVPLSQRLIPPDSQPATPLTAAGETRSIRVAPDGMCASDLCYAAAQLLLSALNWKPDSVEGLVFLTQTPDYILPAASCSLQSRLGLANTCAAIDIELGCSGYVYALWLCSLMVAGGLRRLILLAGDTLSRVAAPEDRTSRYLGDAGTATALEFTEDAAPMNFVLGTDGMGVANLLVPAGGFRTPRSVQTGVRSVCEQGNVRSAEDIYMNAGEIFLSTLTRLPPIVESLLRTSRCTSEQIDYFVFNQTSRFALENIRKRMKIPQAKLAVGVDGFGNTATASIPLVLATTLSESLRKGSTRLVLAGFGAGYSWGAAHVICGPLQIPELIQSDIPASCQSH